MLSGLTWAGVGQDGEVVRVDVPGGGGPPDLQPVEEGETGQQQPRTPGLHLQPPRQHAGLTGGLAGRHSVCCAMDSTRTAVRRSTAARSRLHIFPARYRLHYLPSYKPGLGQNTPGSLSYHVSRQLGNFVLARVGNI